MDKRKANEPPAVTLMVRGQRVVIGVEVIRNVLGLIRTDSQVDSVTELEISRITVEHLRNNKGYTMETCREHYRSQLAALMEIICCCKRSLYVSESLIRHMVAAERAGDSFDWAPTIHTSTSREVKGIELLKCILRKWFPHNKVVQLEEGLKSNRSDSDSSSSLDIHIT